MTHHHVHPRSFGTLTDISTARQKIANHIYLRIERHDTSHPFSCRFDVSIGFFFCSLFQFHITNTTSNVRRTLKLQSITQNKLLNRERERERETTTTTTMTMTKTMIRMNSKAAPSTATMRSHSKRITRTTSSLSLMVGASFYAAATIICSATFHTGAVTAFALKQQQTAPTAAAATAAVVSNNKNIDNNNVHTPVGKDGDGAYSAATKGCFDVIDEATPLILNEVSCQPIRDDRPFHIADYGTADAGTSLGLLTKIVKAVRERKNNNDDRDRDDDGDGDDNDDNDEKEIVIHYEDQRENEWKSVFNHAFGYKKVTDAYGNQIDTPYNLGNVFIEANGVGFHSQCYPSKSIDLGVSFTAMHWLSSSPSSLKGIDVMHSARSLDGPPHAEKKQAEQDWYNILCSRSKELTKGGRFVCVNFCVSKEGYFLGQTDTGVSMWDSFQISWNKLAAGDDGQNLISEEERLGISFPNYYRTTDEFIKGIDKCPDLRLISAEEKIVRCPYREQYIAQSTSEDNKNSKTMTPKEYAKSFVPTTRTWSHSTFKAALSDDKTDQEKEDILEQFWTNYEELAAEAPEEHGMDYVHSYLVIEKI